MDKEILEALGYEVKDRTLADIRELCKGVYAGIEFNLYDDSVVYSGATHNPMDRSTKLPHLTILRNLPTVDGAWVMGSTMGHHQKNDKLPIMEVYEFHGYGAMLVDVDGKETVDLYVARPLSRVLIPSGCNMTLYNLGSERLITLDFANTYDGNNDSTKDLQKEGGPFMALVYDGFHIEFRISPQWVNRRDAHGVRIPQDNGKEHNQDNLTIRLGVEPGNLGQILYDVLVKNDGVRERFQKVGINIVEAESRLVLDQDYSDRKLVELASNAEKPLHKYFRII